MEILKIAYFIYLLLYVYILNKGIYKILFAKSEIFTSVIKYVIFHYSLNIYKRVTKIKNIQNA